MDEKFCPSKRSEWRSWLRKNHALKDEIWLVYYKKHTGKPSVTYRESLEEALCFGWIDGLKKRIDDERYCHRFTPRRKRSHWSALNIRLAQQLIDNGNMTAAGMAAFEQRQAGPEAGADTGSRPEYRLSPEIETALRANSAAWKNLNALAPGYRRQYIGWLSAAKRPETRQKRLQEVLRMLEQNMKPGMK
jgi:uncharacterized protein YdeI (YjbR/CyaY-like superfamily)